MTDEHIIRKADALQLAECDSDPVVRAVAEWALALAARLVVLEEAAEALRDVREVFPQGVCSECAGFEHEVAEVNRIIDAALAKVDAQERP